MDYGLTSNDAIIPANTVKETTRAFTGHEQIAEISGLIHMNARIYDSDIRRFLSADTYIQAPENTQSYNRYSYVLNNPLVYTDPTGHFFKKLFKWIKKNIKTIATIIVSVVIVAATMGYGALASTWIGGLNAAQAGALIGGINGAIMTGSIEGALKGALFGAIGASVSGAIGNAFKGAGNLFTKGVNVGKLFMKSMAHGLSRGIIKCCTRW